MDKVKKAMDTLKKLQLARNKAADAEGMLEQLRRAVRHCRCFVCMPACSQCAPKVLRCNKRTPSMSHSVYLHSASLIC